MTIVLPCLDDFIAKVSLPFLPVNQQVQPFLSCQPPWLFQHPFRTQSVDVQMFLSSRNPPGNSHRSPNVPASTDYKVYLCHCFSILLRSSSNFQSMSSVSCYCSAVWPSSSRSPRTAHGNYKLLLQPTARLLQSSLQFTTDSPLWNASTPQPLKFTTRSSGNQKWCRKSRIRQCNCFEIVVQA